MPMRVTANGLDIEYETTGPQHGPPLLLVNGFSVQLTRWPAGYLDAFADAGFRVIIFDNRDVGLSSKLDALGTPAVVDVASRRVPAPYSLGDMADDTAGLLDALGIDSAHVVGTSMGGMIAQAFAIRHPERTRTMTSVMSTSGAPNLAPPTPEALAVLLQAPADTVDGRVEQAVEAARVLWGDSPFPFDEDETREAAAVSEKRCFHPDGVARQMMAIATAGDRTEALGSLEMPCLVLHGDVDPILPLGHGEATAAAIPGAILTVFEGMGHSLPRELWADHAEAVADLAGLARPS
ncbi:MAG: alpha/beta hydrolase [Acidimicrobiia bacterium]|nr:alpha/beta hydrolase [Acidimicrobiia bacterium]